MYTRAYVWLVYESYDFKYMNIQPGVQLHLLALLTCTGWIAVSRIKGLIKFY